MLSLGPGLKGLLVAFALIILSHSFDCVFFLFIPVKSLNL